MSIAVGLYSPRARVNRRPISGWLGARTVLPARAGEPVFTKDVSLTQLCLPRARVNPLPRDV